MASNDGWPEDLIWVLQAMALDYPEQAKLYPPFVMLGDEIVNEFGDAVDRLESFQVPVPRDIAEILRIFEAQTSSEENWTHNGVETQEFWDVIRRLARQSLYSRDLPLAPETPSSSIYAGEVDRVIATYDGPIRRQNWLLRILRRFRR